MEASEDAHLKHCVRRDWVDDTPFDAVTHKLAFSMGGVAREWRSANRPRVVTNDTSMLKTQGGVVTACVP